MHPAATATTSWEEQLAFLVRDSDDFSSKAFSDRTCSFDCYALQAEPSQDPHLVPECYPFSSSTTTFPSQNNPTLDLSFPGFYAAPSHLHLEAKLEEEEEEEEEDGLAYDASPCETPSPSPSRSPSSSSPCSKGGRKKGSTIYCDESLIRRLLPLSTRQFNQEIGSLSLSPDEIRELKFARRRIKNANAAQKRRSKLSSTLSTLQDQVDALTRQNQELTLQLRQALEENRAFRKNHTSSMR